MERGMLESTGLEAVRDAAGRETQGAVGDRVCRAWR